MECLVSDHESHVKSVITFPTIAENAAKCYNKLKNIRSTNSAPKELTDLMAAHHGNLKEFTVYIEEEKAKILSIINNIQEAFHNICLDIKETLTTDLNHQLKIANTNYAECKMQYESFYFQSTGMYDKPFYQNGSEVITALNGTKDKVELESKVRKILTDIKYAGTFKGALDENIKTCRQRITEQAANLSDQLALRPSMDQKLLPMKKELEYFISQFQKVHFEPMPENPLTDQLQDLKVGLESRLSSSILDSSSDITMVKQWISLQPLSLSLLYRGSRDGYDAVNFHKKVDNTNQTVTLVETTAGKIFGGYSDQEWNDTSGYKDSENAFVFSITNKEKYPIKDPSKAIYCSSLYLSTFGEGHDFIIQDHCHFKQSASCFLSYNSKGKSEFALSGTSRFMVKDIEVFSVQYI
jgi:hypothetical protein